MAGKSDNSKMVTKGRVITRSITSKRPIDMTLNLDCTEEPLSEAQIAIKTKHKDNYDRVMSSLEEMMKEHGAQLVSQSGSVSAYQYKLPTPPSQIVKSNQLTINQGKSQPIKLNVLNNSNNTSQGNIQLVMDSRMGVLLSPMSQQQPVTSTNLTAVAQKTVLNSSTDNNQTRTTRTRAKVMQIQQQEIVEEQTPSQVPKIRIRTKIPGQANVTVSPSPTNNQVISSVKSNKPPPKSPQIPNKPLPPKSSPATLSLTSKPSEQTSIGGIQIGNKNAPSVDVIEESKKNLPDGREIAFNKFNGTRTFPSLVVTAKPHLRAKDVPPQLASKERTELDMKVKNVLMFPAARFTEWLIQQGLIKSEFYCDQHPGNPTKLELGLYNDPSKFPYSGGYVWVSSTCCQDRFVSVFSGSIFQGSTHTPSVLLKLIYHWACQTNIQNVVSWVKVTNVYVKNFYTNLRSICTAAVWDKSTIMGGKGCNIQVGVISLGTTSQDGNRRQVKVEVLGILNPETRQIRLRACEPVHDTDRSFRRRFNSILNPLKDWVHRDSKILTDFTVDKSTLQDMGFNNVIQSSFSEQNPRNHRSNYQIMEYLREIVPRMFQNTLSLLSRPMIQQFLDELVWREMFGSTASRAFNNIVTHIAEQTRLRSKETLLDRLAIITANPFADWSYSKEIQIIDHSIPRTLSPVSNETLSSQPNSDVPLLVVKPKEMLQLKPGPKRKRKRQGGNGTPEPEEKRRYDDSRSRETDKNDRVPLNEFYYGTVDGNPMTIAKEDKRSVYFSCFLCSHTMKSNTEVMQHMISHVPPRVPGQSVAHVCRYCCAAFSSQHQMVTHVDEAHSKFGKGDGFMVVCGICEQKFGNSYLLINHMSCVHLPSEMPYRCESCNYRTSSHKDVIDHYYNVHQTGEGLQCPYCLKIMQYNVDGHASRSNIHAYLVHMQRHIVRREQGRGNKCNRCCLWFNQKSALKKHQEDLHQSYMGVDSRPYTTTDKGIMISKSQHQLKRILIRSPSPEFWSPDDKFKKWSSGPIKVKTQASHLRCQECEEDIDETQHYPGEQKCTQCRYVTCCWRAFKEHQQQIHNERPMTSLVVPSPLASIPLEKKMKCSCGFATKDGNLLATHLVKCKKMSARPIEDRESSGMLDSLGLVPKAS